MCGRYTLTTNPATGAEEWIDLYEGDIRGVPDLGPLFEPRWNVMPTQLAPVLRAIEGERRIELMRWGLLPAWMQGKKGAPLINARSETVAEKPSFRNALKARRCIVPADGFFEWQAPPEGAPKSAKKQPWWFRRKDHKVFALAGLWEPPNEEAPQGSYTLITTEANDVVARFHDRMPVILPREAIATWLDPQVKDPAAVVPLLRPFDPALMEATAVSKRLNGSRDNDPSLVAPDAEPDQPRLF